MKKRSAAPILLLLVGLVGVALFVSLRVSSATIVVHGQKHIVPLPMLSIKTGDNRYLSFLPNPESYFQQKLPQLGWHQVDQMGALNVMSNGAVWADVIRQFKCTRFISELSINGSEQQENWREGVVTPNIE